MPDLDVVVKSLRRCSDMTICPADCYYRKYAPDCVAKLHRDAINLLKDQNELLKEQEAEIERLKGELHGFGDLFHMLSEKTKEVMAEQPEHGTGLAHWVDDTGHWIEGDRNGTDSHTRTTGEMIDTFRCSWCGFYQYWKTPFCPNCGSKMEGGEQNATD